MLGKNFYYQEDNLLCDGIKIENIVKKYSTPVFIYSELHIKENLQRINKAIKGKQISKDPPFPNKEQNFQSSGEQTNHEGEMIDLIHQAREQADGIILNPAGWSFRSVAIMDALKMFLVLHWPWDKLVYILHKHCQSL